MSLLGWNMQTTCDRFSLLLPSYSRRKFFSQSHGGLQMFLLSSNEFRLSCGRLLVSCGRLPVELWQSSHELWWAVDERNLRSPNPVLGKVPGKSTLMIKSVGPEVFIYCCIEWLKRILCFLWVYIYTFDLKEIIMTNWSSECHVWSWKAGNQS